MATRFPARMSTISRSPALPAGSLPAPGAWKREVVMAASRYPGVTKMGLEQREREPGVRPSTVKKSPNRCQTKALSSYSHLQTGE